MLKRYNLFKRLTTYWSKSIKTINNHSITKKVDQFPLNKENFKAYTSHYLHFKGNNTLIFKYRLPALILELTFLLIAISGALLPFVIHISSTISQGYIIAFSFTWGVISIYYGRYIYLNTTQRFFDKKQNIFQYTQAETFTQLKHYRYSLKNIYAIQLLYKSSDSPGEGRIESYELNIVLQNAQRINIADYASKKNIHIDAQKLAIFLEKPILDLTNTNGKNQHIKK